MRSLSTSALGQPSETNETRGAGLAGEGVSGKGGPIATGGAERARRAVRAREELCEGAGIPLQSKLTKPESTRYSMLMGSRPGGGTKKGEWMPMSCANASITAL